jgi:molecular chaperone DnaK (HSP70)
MGQGNTEKVPSRISYGVPPAVEIKWGNQIRPNDKSKVHALMKLKLDERLKQSIQLKLLLAFLANNLQNVDLEDVEDEAEDGLPEYPGKEPVDIVADYLTELRKHVWKELSEQYGAAVLETLDKEIVVTVPAVWSERAKDLTVRAVKRANFVGLHERICMVTEPEAAAIYTLKGMTEGANKEEIQVCKLLIDV